MDTNLLQQRAQKIVAKGKGILAADESYGTCQKRFEELGVHCTEETRRAYRQILMTAPETEKYLSGIILFDETIRQATNDGIPFVKILKEKKIMIGIKVDEGREALALHENEKITKGLDRLKGRITEYKEFNAEFAKWRAVIKIKGDEIPSEACLYTNAHALARYAAICQEQNIVPIVEPEVLMDGDHDLKRSFEITARIQKTLFEELKKQDIYLPGVILKASMVIAGKNAKKKSTAEEIAQWTVKCLQENVPKEIAGIVFLSGGQNEIEATENLNVINKMFPTLPWPLTFSYGRALQNPTLKIWSRDPSNSFHPSSIALLHRCKMSSLASLGKYTEANEAEYKS